MVDGADDGREWVVKLQLPGGSIKHRGPLPGPMPGCFVVHKDPSQMSGGRCVIKFVG